MIGGLINLFLLASPLEISPISDKLITNSKRRRTVVSEEALGLKAKWMEMPAEFFEVMTFGELMPDQQFISLPLPGDNDDHGGFHGGFRGTHFIFTKTHEIVSSAAGFPHGRAVNNLGLQRGFPDSMPVILLI